MHADNLLMANEEDKLNATVCPLDIQIDVFRIGGCTKHDKSIEPLPAFWIELVACEIWQRAEIERLTDSAIGGRRSHSVANVPDSPFC